MARLFLFVPMLAVAGLAGPAPAQLAGDVSLSGLVVNICTLTPGVGTLGSEADGRTLSSEGRLAAPATVAVAATGAAPTLSFTAPTLTTAPGFSGTPTTTIQVSNGGTVLVPYTSAAATTPPLTRLLETVTVRSRVVNDGGFASGLYTVRTTVTCQQN